MKKLPAITAAIIAVGLSAHAQTLILSDSYDTGGVATNDLNYNLVVRQAGSAATSTYSNDPGNGLTAAGELNPAPAFVAEDLQVNLQPYLADNNFSMQVDAKLFAAVDQESWTSISMLGDVDNGRHLSPMTFLIRQQSKTADLIWVQYGVGSKASMDAQPIAKATLDAALGVSFNVEDWHTYGIRALASSTTNGTFTFYVDGVAILSDLPYQFNDSTGRKLRWINTGTDSVWDNLSISTFAIADYNYLLLDTFDTPNTGNVNEGIIARQSESLLPTGYDNYANLATDFSINSSNLLCEGIGGGLRSTASYASSIVGNDFELSFKLTMDFTGNEWMSVYLVDAGGSIWGANDFGLHARGVGSTSAFILNDLTLNDGVNNLFEVTVEEMTAALGSAYDKTQEHLIQLISTAGAGGTNTYDFVVDGVVVKSGLKYYFADDTVRKIDFWTSFTDGTGGAEIEDLSLKIIKGLTYEDWVADDTSLTQGVNDGRTQDPDLDEMDNLLEYALGGDPLVDDAASILPSTDYSVTDSLKYVFRRRSDASTRGLVYDVVLNVDGLQPPWINASDTFESGSSAINQDFNAVTNTFDITAIDLGFLNLEVTEN